MRALAVVENPFLDGPLPLSLVHVPLDTLRFGGTGVCAPSEAGTWMDAIRVVEGTGEVCPALTDRQLLSLLYEATGGEEWLDHTNWLTDAPLDQWHGVVVNEGGRVTGLSLRQNNLTGPVPFELSYLSELESLSLPQNALTGEIPPEFGGLSHLSWLNLAENRLTGPVPAELRDLEVLETLSLHHNELSGPIPSELGDLSHLSFLNLSYNSLTGPMPVALRNLEVLRVLTLNHNELSGSIPPQLGDLKALEHLHLETNALTGTIPPEFGQLLTLKSLGLSGNTLTGPIPPQLGDLRELSRLNLAFNELSGPIPPELGQLTTLESLDLGGNRLSGSVPHQLGELRDLKELWLEDNEFSGPIPPELGQLEELRELHLFNNELSDLMPPELGNLGAMRWLSLGGNDLSGPVPPEFGALINLRGLGLSFNETLSGPLPETLTRLDSLETLLASRTGLCASTTGSFLAWLNRIVRHRVRRCSGGIEPRGDAYLVQAVQSRDHPVPLVAGRDALLRVFLTVPTGNDVGVPPVRARFHVGSEEVYSAEIQGKPGPLPPEINEGNLEISANVQVPGEILRDGLEMVVEIDPTGTMDPALGLPRRLPADGRTALDVQTLPTMDLTVVPFLWTEDPDSSVVSLSKKMASDPDGHELLGPSRARLPVNDWNVTAHEPVLSSTNNAFQLLSQTKAIRTMEGGQGYWKGIMQGAVGAGGVAALGGWSSFSLPVGEIMAHELGHNMALWHAPCGDPSGVDGGFPYSTGRIGAWGYDFATSQLVPPGQRDFMSYCDPTWISDYHFSNALRYRLAHETQPAAQAADHALLLWGETDPDGNPHLEPAFVVHAPPSLPDSTGDHQLTGRDGGGREIFALSFGMPATADAEGVWSSFAFALPVRPGWEALATITLTTPNGKTALLDGDTDRPVTILRDTRTGRVRGILDGGNPAVQVSADRSGPSTAVGLDMLTSRGIPRPEAWRRD